MYTKENKRQPQHRLAEFPFRAAVTAKACVPPAPGRRCTSQYINAGTATVDCSGGALTAQFVNAEGVMMATDLNTLTATCDVSKFSEMGGCGLAANGTVAAAAAAATGEPGVYAYASDAWGPDCVCGPDWAAAALRDRRA